MGRPPPTTCRIVRQVRSWIDPSLAASALLFLLSSCRIYRQDAAERGRPEVASPEPSQPNNGPLPQLSEGAGGEPPAAPPAQAVSLWVLNRSNSDLQARDVERAGTVAPAPNEPPGAALVVLGFGRPQVCADRFARRALTLVADGRGLVEALAQVLDEIRRWRWPDDSGSFAVALRGADGSFGAVQSVPASALSPQLLLSAVDRHAVIDGRSSRWGRDAPALPLDASRHESTLAACKDASMGPLRGALGVLLLGATGEMVAGVLERELPADAGVMSLATQFGVSLAVDKGGGVLLISDCPTLPDEAIAAHVLARLQEGGTEAPELAVGVCPQAHAILTPGDARVATAEPLAWARATASVLTETLPLHRRPPGSDADAGAPPLEPVPPP